VNSVSGARSNFFFLVTIDQLSSLSDSASCFSVDEEEETGWEEGCAEADCGQVRQSVEPSIFRQSRPIWLTVCGEALSIGDIEQGADDVLSSTGEEDQLKVLGADRIVIGWEVCGGARGIGESSRGDIGDVTDGDKDGDGEQPWDAGSTSFSVAAAGGNWNSGSLFQTELLAVTSAGSIASLVSSAKNWVSSLLVSVETDLSTNFRDFR
jgi:hypothetical protein